MGIASVGIDTILLFENRVSQIDLPCSGVKSLWTGALFLLAATWIERRPLNPRWMVVAIVVAALLFAANLARVGVLVLVGQVMGWELAAEMLHVPLGILAFAGICAAALKLLPLTGRPRVGDGPPEVGHEAGACGPRVWLAPALAGVFLLLGLLLPPRVHSGPSASPPAWPFPSEIVTAPLPLSPEEVAWLLMGMAVVMLGWYYREQRFELRGQRVSAGWRR